MVICPSCGYNLYDRNLVKQRIINLLSTNSSDLTRIYIQRKLGIGNLTINRYIRELTEEGKLIEYRVDKGISGCPYMVKLTKSETIPKEVVSKQE